MLGATLLLLLWPWEDSPGKGIISEAQAWQGFSNGGVLTVGALFVVAKAVDSTGVVSIVMKKILGKPKSLFVAQMRLLFPVAIASAFMNNTPIVAMLIPVVETWAPSIGHDKAKFLMPLSFASMLGGMCSMMGTSTNLVVAGLLLKKNPEMQPFGLFDIVPVGGPCALAGIIYMAVFSKCLLRGDSKEDGKGRNAGRDGARGDDGMSSRTYRVVFVFDPSGRQQHQRLTPVDLGLAGLSLREDGVMLLEVLAEGGADGDDDGGGEGLLERGQKEVSVESVSTVMGDSNNKWETTVLSDGDLLAVRCHAEKLGPLRRDLSQLGVRLLSEMPTLRHGRRQGRRRNRRYLAEVVVGARSPVLGMKCQDLNQVVEISDLILSRYGAALVSVREDTVAIASARKIWRNLANFSKKRGRALSSGTVDGTRLLAAKHRVSASDTVYDSPSLMMGEGGDERVVEIGDVLLMEVFPTSVDLILPDFTLVTPVPGSKPPRSGTFMDEVRKWVAGVTLALMVILSAANVMSLLMAALLASSVLLAFKTITLKAAFSAINGRTLLAIVTTFGVGTAFETTGLAHWIAMGLIGMFGSLGPFGVVLSVALVTAVVGCAISNNAVVILMYPICQTLARQTEGVSLRQLLVVLLVGASSSFLTPMSYQTNLMVFTPGGYKFSDYAKFGFGLQVMMVSISIAMAFVAADMYED